MDHYFLIVDYEKFKLRTIDMPVQSDGTDWSQFDEGVRIKGTVQEPIRLELDPINYSDYVNMPVMTGIPLVMREDLLSDMRAFGVDNIDAYSTILRDTQSGDEWTDYMLCNVIGLLDVFDMSASKLHPDSPPELAYLFNEIVIDENKAKGHHFFRPHGRMSQLLVSEELKNYLESKKKYQHIEYIAPEDFA